MPRRDGTGPMGDGPMTGRGFGVCETADFRGHLGGRPGGRAGRRSGRGPGRGPGGYFCRREDGRRYGTLEEEKEFLQRRLAMIEEELADQ